MEDTILILLCEDARWMNEAVHKALQQARRTGQRTALLKMIPMQHTGWLGVEQQYVEFSAAEYDVLRAVHETAEDYGIEVSVEAFQYVTLADALVEASSFFHAATLFATLPHHWLSVWRSRQLHRMARKLAQHGTQLDGLDTHERSKEPELGISIRGAGVH